MPGPDPIRPVHGDSNNYPLVLDNYHDILNKGIVIGGIANDFPTNTEQPGHLDNKHVQVTTPGVADTEFAVTHNLGRIPTAAFPVYKNAACDIYASATPWTITQVFLKATVTNVAVRLQIY